MKLRNDLKEFLTYYRGGRLAIPSVPGAGKTTLLSHLTAHIIETEADARVLIVTYMNSAVANFKQRIDSLLKEKGILVRNYDVMTLHSLASTIVKESPASLGLAKDYNILDELECINHLKTAFEAWLSTHEDIFYSKLLVRDFYTPKRIETIKKNFRESFIADVGRAISLFKGNNITSSDAMSYIHQLPEDSYLRWAFEIYSLYQDRLRLNGAVDFDDLILLAYRLLTSEHEILSKFQDRWNYFFEDEAQDSNMLQEKILELLSQKCGNLVRVGDPNQAILSTFTIADPKLFTEFINANDRKEIKTSGRSSIEVIRLANHLVECVKSLNEFESVRDSLEYQLIEPVADANFKNPENFKYGIRFYEYEDEDEELSHICSLAAKYIQLHPDKTCAVLLRTNNQVESMVEIFHNNGIKAVEVSSYPLEDLITRKIYYCLKFINRPERTDNLIDVLRYVLAPEIKDIHPLNMFIHRSRVEDILYPIDRIPVLPEDVGNEEKEIFYRAIETAKKLIEAGDMSIDKLIIYIMDLLRVTGESRAIGEAVAEEARKRLYDPGWRIEDVIDELASPKNKYNNLASVFYQKKGFEARPGEVMVLTYHKAKGLEWHNVFMGTVEARDFPLLLTHSFIGETWYLKEEERNPFSLIEAEFKSLMGENVDPDFKKQAKLNIISENLRLLYVGITRAKETLVITSHRNDRYDKPLDNMLFKKIFHEFIQEERLKWKI
ncbi:ATP-dependent helicase [Calorimonas adulescens]|jgi:UvrD/REP helicase.|uniref:DNA 3'-5' helicase n=1 Tax=Calorimonas adulescens TaxID=2606906 RepID=A0A5D8QCA1_9THEO|nr:ATP-dependent helicase [Calorimonas adulescens]TZE82162.1 ATP-dependent helicase [Calorimonas adulescens]